MRKLAGEKTSMEEIKDEKTATKLIGFDICQILGLPDENGCSPKLSATEIRHKLLGRGYGKSLEKTTVNRALYQLKDDGYVMCNTNSRPPKWEGTPRGDVPRKNSKKKKQSEPPGAVTYVLVDCDNKPHCFLNAAGRVYDKQQVHGFAGCQYNFWKPGRQDQYSALTQSKTSMKDVAEVEMCAFAVTKYVLAHEDAKPSFILVSGDKAVETIAFVLRRMGAQVKTVVSGWNELKMLLD